MHDSASKRRGGQTVLCERARLAPSDATAFVHQALEEIRTYIRDHALTPNGPPYAHCSPIEGETTLDVEAGWPINSPDSGAGQIHGATLPPATLRRRAAAIKLL